MIANILKRILFAVIRAAILPAFTNLSPRRIVMVTAIAGSIMTILTMLIVSLLPRGDIRSIIVIFLVSGLVFVAYLMGLWMRVVGEYEGYINRRLAKPAIENMPQSKVTVRDTWDGGFDVDDPKYPEELDIALQAWRAVCSNPSYKQPKEQLTDWLKATYPKLSGAAVERIVGVCNWDKNGGRPKSR